MERYRIQTPRHCSVVCVGCARALTWATFLGVLLIDSAFSGSKCTAQSIDVTDSIHNTRQVPQRSRITSDSHHGTAESICDEQGTESSDDEATDIALKHANEAVVSSLNDRVKILLANNRFDEAMDDIKMVLKTDSKNEFAMLSRALIDVKEEDFASAVQSASILIAEYPNNHNGWFFRAYSNQELQEFDESLKDCDEAIRLAPANGRYFMFRGMIHHSREKYAEALRDFEEFVRLEPKNGDAYWFRATAKYSLGEFAAALADADKAVRFKPDSLDFLVGRALMHEERGDSKKAKADLEAASRLAPDSGEINGRLAVFLARCRELELRDYKRAIALAEKCCKDSDWKSSVYFATLAYVHAQADNFDLAVRFQKRAIQEGADDQREKLEQDLRRYESGNKHVADDVEERIELE